MIQQYTFGYISIGNNISVDTSMVLGAEGRGHRRRLPKAVVNKLAWHVVTDFLTLGRDTAGGGLAQSMCEASEKPSNSLPVHGGRGRQRAASLGKGWVCLGGWTLPDHREFWSRRFKQKEGRTMPLFHLSLADLCWAQVVCAGLWPRNTCPGPWLLSLWDLPHVPVGFGSHVARQQALDSHPAWEVLVAGVTDRSGHSHSLQKGAWGPTVMRKEAQLLGGQLSGFLRLPKGWYF